MTNHQATIFLRHDDGRRFSTFIVARGALLAWDATFIQQTYALERMGIADGLVTQVGDAVAFPASWFVIHPFKDGKVDG